MIPMHCLTNPSLPGTPAELNKALGGSTVKVMVMQPGGDLGVLNTARKTGGRKLSVPARFGLNPMS